MLLSKQASGSSLEKWDSFSISRDNKTVFDQTYRMKRYSLDGEVNGDCRKQKSSVSFDMLQGDTK